MFGDEGNPASHFASVTFCDALMIREILWEATGQVGRRSMTTHILGGICKRIVWVVNGAA